MEGLGLPNEDRKKKRSVETLRRMDIIIVAWPSITGPRHTTPSMTPTTSTAALIPPTAMAK